MKKGKIEKGERMKK